MSTSTEKSVWASGKAYEPYVGRWSRLVAREFVEWLAIPSAAKWLDVGCGTDNRMQRSAQVKIPR